MNAKPLKLLLLKDGCKLLEQALHEATESLGRGSTTSTTAQPA